MVIKRWQQGGFDSAFTIQSFDYPIFRALKQTGQGNFEMFWPEHLNSTITGFAGRLITMPVNCILPKLKRLLREGTFFTKNSVGIELSKVQGQDIDTRRDWEFAERLYQLRMPNDLRNYVLNNNIRLLRSHPKPSEDELREYYERKYYQDEHATYERHYGPEELDYFHNKISQKDFVVSQMMISGKKGPITVGYRMRGRVYPGLL